MTGNKRPTMRGHSLPFLAALLSGISATLLFGGRDVLPQAALKSKTRNTKVRVLIRKLQISCIVCGLRHTPGCLETLSIFYLTPNDYTISVF